MIRTTIPIKAHLFMIFLLLFVIDTPHHCHKRLWTNALALIQMVDLISSKFVLFWKSISNIEVSSTHFTKLPFAIIDIIIIIIVVVVTIIIIITVRSYSNYDDHFYGCPKLLLVTYTLSRNIYLTLDVQLGCIQVANRFVFPQ